MKKRTYKRMLSCLLALVMLLSMLPALNASASIIELVATGGYGADDNMKYYFYDGEAEVIGYKGSPISVKIPNEVYGYPVTGISESAFEGCVSLKSIMIPDGVTTIWNSAFSNCSSLESVSLPSTVITIGECAFHNCSSLSSIEIPEGVTTIESEAFSGCSALTSIVVNKNNTVYDSRDNCNAIIDTEANTLIQGCQNTTIPSDVTRIEQWAFLNCTTLKSIEIPSNVSSIGDGLFYGCTALEDVIIPEGIQTINSDMFNGCTALKNLTIPSSASFIGSYAFYGCISLESIAIPSKVTYIGDDAFLGCVSLSSIVVESGNSTYDSRDNCNSIIETATNTLIKGCNNSVIPKSVTSIGNSAFSFCTELSSITIPQGVTSISAYAFYGCSSLSGIILPSDLIIIDSSAFDETAYYNDTDNWQNNVLYIDTVLLKADETISGDYVINSGTTLIADGAFSGCHNLESVTLSESVFSIGDDAFRGCTSLVSITVLGNADIIARVGHRAFYSTAYFDDDNNWQNGVLYLDNVLLEAKSTLNGEYSVKSGTTLIADGAFSGCDELERVNLPEGVKGIGIDAFNGCENLCDILIPLSVIRIGYGAFDGCSSGWLELVIHGYEGSYAEKYAKDNDIRFNSTEEIPSITPPDGSDVLYDMNVYSDRSGMNVQVGEHIRLGVVMFKDGAEVEGREVSDISFVLDDSNIVKPLGYKIEDNVYIVEFEALKAGTAYVTFSDAESGFAAQVPVTAYDKSKTSFTLDSIINFVNGYYLKDVASVSGIFADNYSYTVDETTGDATVKFDAYNSSFIYGAVEVYDANGNLADAVVLDKYESGATSLKEIFIENPLHMYSDFVEGNYFSDTFYRAASYSKKTSVSVVIPKGGYINITTDAYSSDVVCIANCIDMLLQVKDVAGDIKGYREASNEFIKLTTEKAVEKIIKESIKPKSIAKKLAKGFTKEVLMTKNSMGDFMDSVVNNINTLDIATFAIETAKGFAFGTGEEVAIALTGPGYKEVIKTLLTVGKITEIGNQYLDFVYSMDCGVISIHNQEGASRTSENVTVKCETSFDNDVALRVFNVVPESELLDNIKAQQPDLYNAMMKDLSYVYNISMIKNGEETQPQQEVEVYIPVNPELLPYTGMGVVKVYRVEEDGTLTDMKAKLEGDFVVFTTEHFSLYILSIESVEDTEPETSEPVVSDPIETKPIDTKPSEPTEDKGVLGDVNGDGKVNIKDATQIQKFAAKLFELTEDEILCADVNNDSKVNVKDATVIQKYVAKFETGYLVGETLVLKKNS